MRWLVVKGKNMAPNVPADVRCWPGKLREYALKSHTVEVSEDGKRARFHFKMGFTTTEEIPKHNQPGGKWYRRSWRR